MRGPFNGRLGALVLAVTALCCRNVHSLDMQQFSVNIYGNETHDISPLLYGIFFEEVKFPQHSCLTSSLLCCMTGHHAAISEA